MSSKEIEQLVVMPDETNAEAILKTTKNITDIFNFVPVIGASISKALEYSIEEIYQKRVAEFIQNINKAMQDIPKRIYSSEEFADITRITLKNFIEESSKVKRDNIFKIYNYYIKHDFDCAATHEQSSNSVLDNCLLWEKIAASLSEGSFLFFLEIKELQDKRGKENCTTWWGELPVRTLQDTYIGELSTCGLIRQVMSYAPTWSDVNQKTGYHISQAGEEFLTWLDINHA